MNLILFIMSLISLLFLFKSLIKFLEVRFFPDEEKNESNEATNKTLFYIKNIVYNNDIIPSNIFNDIQYIKEHIFEPKVVRNNIYVDIDENDKNDELLSLIGKSLNVSTGRLSSIGGKASIPIRKGYLISGLDKKVREYFCNNRR